MDQSLAMRLFVKVVEEGSFSKAGPRLGITQSSASRNIAALEERLGTQLIQRSTRKHNLTEAGQIYYERARQIIADIDDAHIAVGQMNDEPSGVLRITTAASFGRRHIAPLLGEFKSRYPMIKVGLSLNDSIEDVIGAGYDVAIRFGKLNNSSLIAKHLAACRSIICAHPDYLKEAGTPQRPGDLENHNCLTFRDMPGHNIWHFERRRKSYSVSVSGSLYSDNSDALLSAAVSKLGIVYLPSWMVSSDIQRKKLVPILQDYDLMPKTIPMHAVFAPNRHLAPKIRVFLDFIKSEFDTQIWS